ncbi:hypothetical protein EV424DRAFT_1345339 [Suillus variegatus]|nr:hypothetical protein EV424DRAFT_1345339 [Suillus variegatus]
MACALGPDGKLKDASAIDWYNDPDDDTPFPAPPPPPASASVSRHSDEVEVDGVTTDAATDDEDSPLMYQETKAMGDADHEGAKQCKSDLMADIQTIFTYDVKAINPDTGKEEAGHWCKVCKAKGVTRKYCFLKGSVTSLHAHVRR